MNGPNRSASWRPLTPPLTEILRVRGNFPNEAWAENKKRKLSFGLDTIQRRVIRGRIRDEAGMEGVLR